VSRTVCEPPSVGGQTIRKTGRAETLDHAEEVLQCVREYRVKAEFTLGRVIDTLVHRKRVAPAIGLLAVAAAFSRSHFMPVCIISRLVIHNFEQQMSSCGALRPAEVVSLSLRYTGPSRSLSRGSRHPLDGLDFYPTRERERELLYRFYCFTYYTCINAHRPHILVFTFFPTTLAILPNSSSRFLHAKNTRYQTPTYLVLEPCLQISTMPTIYHL
jgi:hypothetical protein